MSHTVINKSNISRDSSELKNMNALLTSLQDDSFGDSHALGVESLTKEQIDQSKTPLLAVLRKRFEKS